MKVRDRDNKTKGWVIVGLGAVASILAVILGLNKTLNPSQSHHFSAGLAIAFAMQAFSPATAVAEQNKGPLLESLSATEPLIPTVDRLDTIAFKNQVALDTLRTSNASEELVNDALVAYVKAELDLNEERRHTWASIPRPFGFDYHVSEPLLLAMLDLHIEVRRRLGPDFGTSVPGLAGSDGCDGDLVAQRLIFDYGARVAHGASVLPSGEELVVAALDPIARQVACLGARQLADLEAAMSDGFDAVSERMEGAGLARLIPAFVRLTAPVQVLIVDAGKHRGVRSRAWQWFERHGDVLQEVVAVSGWASGQVLAWDRRQGRLVGFQGCTQAAQPQGCIDLSRFIESIRDPRALGFGQCAFAGMLSQGIQRVDGDERYVCPVSECSADSRSNANRADQGPLFGPPDSLTNTGRMRGAGAPLEPGARRASNLPSELSQLLSQLWPQLLPLDAAAVGPRCARSHLQLQGVEFDPSECVALNPGAGNPFEQYAACVVSSGIGDEPQIGGELRGVPAGYHCKFANLIDDIAEWLRELGTTRSGTNVDDDGNYVEPPRQPDPKPDVDSSPVTNEEYEENKKILEALCTGGIKRACEGTDKLPDELQKLVDELGGADQFERSKLKGKIRQLLQKRAWQSPDSTAGRQIIRRIDREIYLLQKQLDRMQDCADPGVCSNECTGLGRQVGAMNACADTLLDDIARAAGLPSRKELVRRVDIASHPRPDQDGDSVGIGLDACLGDTGLSAKPAACGLILCTDGFLSTGLPDGGCTCGNDLQVYMPQEICLNSRCADGELPGPDCNCPPVEDYAPPVPGGGGNGPGDPWLKGDVIPDTFEVSDRALVAPSEPVDATKANPGGPGISAAELTRSSSAGPGASDVRTMQR